MASSTGSEIALHDMGRSEVYHESDDSFAERRGSHGQEHSNVVQASLPPVDGGREAWLFLAGSFFIEALVWGAYLLSSK